MLFGILQCVLALAVLDSVNGEGWRWPDDAEGSESVRIDAKVGFFDEQTRNGKRNNRDNVQADEASFQQPSDTEGFYNRPPGSGRFPVRVEQGYDNEIRINGRPAYNVDNRNQNQKYQSDGTLDSLQYCKCVSTPVCEVRNDYSNACGANQYLCCYKGSSKPTGIQSEYFNEIDDERPSLFPQNQPGVLVGPNGPSGIIGVPKKQVLVGPGGPTGVIGPNKPVLVGPQGPTGVIGPQGTIGTPKRQALVGPDGPTGVIGPNKPVLVGPQGPTGIIGPEEDDRNLLVRPLGSNGDVGYSETAQRGVLVGPGGPTGIIGPAFNRPLLVGPGGPSGIFGSAFNRPVLVGPGGPTGIIGPRFVGANGLGPSGFGRNSRNPGILVGPGGPTGSIGPGRQILVGPGGPTGRIGPRNYFGK